MPEIADCCLLPKSARNKNKVLPGVLKMVQNCADVKTSNVLLPSFPLGRIGVIFVGEGFVATKTDNV